MAAHSLSSLVCMAHDGTARHSHPPTKTRRGRCDAFLEISTGTWKKTLVLVSLGGRSVALVVALEAGGWERGGCAATAVHDC